MGIVCAMLYSAAVLRDQAGQIMETSPGHILNGRVEVQFAVQGLGQSFQDQSRQSSAAP